MVRRRIVLCLAVACLVLGIRAEACLWDRDTLADEERGLPEMSSIILSRYERHTPEFLERRIRLAQEALPTADASRAKALYDDLGVAYDRRNEQAKAIAAMQEKIRRFGVDYTTAANLGTFYAHAGQLDHAETWIRRVLKINPNAHFGREWVQLHAIRYFRSARSQRNAKAEVKPATERKALRFRFWGEAFLKESEPHLLGLTSGTPSELSAALRRGKFPANALEGISGIIRMGDRESPELYAALAQLLQLRGDNSLAYLAYIRALEAGGASHPFYSEWLDASRLVHRNIQLAPGQLPLSQNTYRRGRDYARGWVAAYQARERELIRAGEDPEAAANYAAFYRKWGRPQDPLPLPPTLAQNGWNVWIPALSVFFITWVLVRRRKRLRRLSGAQPSVG